ncbi:invasion associated locus B family protein [Phyllobacterium zundukense]|uniref:Invasion associated locus B family protein n=1 Tax=Phyllobacterium zundukense TaxID=1867719 RepID=A0ACD4CXS3_9HYPH|nr:invasion associated locus B family protein [Phyllobacterium zundukense]UXN58385.1 invasion associated locus B family protein [Phyllobacterium zundukense]
MNKVLKFSSLFLAILAATPGFAQAPVSTLPGGATSLQETYQDWRVSCMQQAGSKRCALAQQQTQENGQLVLAIELQPSAKANEVIGNLMMPFGLALANGVTLQPEEGKPLPTLQFKTCVAQGCIVPLPLDAATVSALRKASGLKVGATASDSAQPVQLRISLKGFAPALDRTIELAK